VEPWDSKQWAMPVFIRHEELTGRTLRVIYDDADPSHFVREEQVPPGQVEQGPEDDLMGAGFTEIRLTRLLG
jgi:hypothetical protein